MKKKIFTLLLALVLIGSLAACGEEETPVNEEVNDITNGAIFKGTDEENLAQLSEPDAPLDPQVVYSKLAYTPEMFYGDYSILGGEDAQQEFALRSEFFKWTRQDKETEFTTLPFRIEAGFNTIGHSISYVEEYDWMRACFMRRYEGSQYYLDEVICAYEISGNKLTLRPLDTFNVDQESKKITYTFADQTWEYTFSFSGRHLTLTSGNESVTLLTCLDTYHEKDYYFAEGYLSSGSQSANNIDYIRLHKADEEGSFNVEMVDGENSYNSIAVLQENGLLTFTLALEDRVKTYQYVCFISGDDGLILTDGENIYFYNASYRDRHSENASKYLTEEQKAQLDELSDAQLEAIVKKTENLLADLADAYQKAGLNVTVNAQTGEIALDSTVLFGVNESEISEEGKMFLQKFMNVYTSVVFDTKYADFVSKIMVEGHTDTNGSYDLNKNLSEARANSVKEYCLSAECGVDEIYAGALQTMLEAIGYSYDKPVYNENGEVDMDASRRVSFRFIINLGE